MNLVSLNRWKAAGIHLCLSALIAATAVVVMLALWYPRPYFDAMGGSDLGYVPSPGRERIMTAVVDKRDGRVVGILPFNPY